MNNLVKLSFDDDARVIERVGNKTKVQVVSYFSNEKLLNAFPHQGFTDTFSHNLVRILKKYGYKYVEKYHGWAVTTEGVTTLRDGDTDDPKAAMRIAITKARAKAYKKAAKCVEIFYKNLSDMCSFLEESTAHLEHIRDEEYEALERCIETGYCKPQK